MLALLLNLFVSIFVILLGFYILFAGRHAIWATLGIVSLSAAANLMAVLVAGGSAGRDLIEMQAWGLVGIAVLIGVLGILLGKFKPDWAVLSIGFIAGADAALWFYNITIHFMTNIAKQSGQTAYITGLIVILVGAYLVWG